MKPRLVAHLLILSTAAILSGCTQSCFTSDDIRMSQESLGDPSAPEVTITKFPVIPTNKITGCETVSLVRVELSINPYGYVQNVQFIDPWPEACANEYVRRMKFSKLIDTPLAVPLEHFRVIIHNSRVVSRQCIRLTQ